MMKFAQIGIAAAIACSFALPTTAQASDIATLNGWGALFAAAHAGQNASAQVQGKGDIQLSLFKRQPMPVAQPVPEAMPAPAPVTDPAPVAQMPGMDQTEPGDQPSAGGDAIGESAEAAQQQTAKGMTNANANLSATVKVSGEQLGNVLNKVDGIYQSAGTVVEGVTGGVLGTVQNLANMGSGAGLAGNLSQTGALNIAGIASANVASSLSATASVLNAGQLGAISAMTSNLIQNVIAARPASLTGLLR